MLSELDHQMCLVKLESLVELYGTAIYDVDKLTGEMYAIVDDTARKTGLQAYAEEEPEDLEEAVGFVPKDTLTPKEFEAPCKPRRQSSRPYELSIIDEQTEMQILN